jgi:hypothetical protein
MLSSSALLHCPAVIVIVLSTKSHKKSYALAQHAMCNHVLVSSAAKRLLSAFLVMQLHEVLQQLSHGVCGVLSTMVPALNDQPLANAEYALVLEELVHAGRANHGCSYMRYLLVAEKTCQTVATAQHDCELPAMQYTKQILRWYLRPLKSCAQR